MATAQAVAADGAAGRRRHHRVFVQLPRAGRQGRAERRSTFMLEDTATGARSRRYRHDLPGPEADERRRAGRASADAARWIPWLFVAFFVRRRRGERRHDLVRAGELDRARQPTRPTTRACLQPQLEAAAPPGGAGLAAAAARAVQAPDLAARRSCVLADALGRPLAGATVTLRLERPTSEGADFAVDLMPAASGRLPRRVRAAAGRRLERPRHHPARRRSVRARAAARAALSDGGTCPRRSRSSRPTRRGPALDVAPFVRREADGRRQRAASAGRGRPLRRLRPQDRAARSSARAAWTRRASTSPRAG